jgi:NADPH-dependent glutamate synthase beta subunit-like oxidoreductase
MLFQYCNTGQKTTLKFIVLQFATDCGGGQEKKGKLKLHFRNLDTVFAAMEYFSDYVQNTANLLPAPGKTEGHKRM